VQLAVAPEPVSVHVPVNVPVPLVANVTVPVGVVTAVLFRSVTVAVHDEPWLTYTEEGAQLTLVEVDRTVTVIVADCAPLLALNACVESPL
jgi:hypothetical protein